VDPLYRAARARHERWYLKLPNAGLDRVTLFTRTDARLDLPERRATCIPVANWPLPHLYPILPLQVSAADMGSYMLRIEASNTFSTPIQFVSESGLSSRAAAHLAGCTACTSGCWAWWPIFGADQRRGHARHGLCLVQPVCAGHQCVGGHRRGRGRPAPVAPTRGGRRGRVRACRLLSFAPLLVFIALTASLRARSAVVFWLFCALAAMARWRRLWPATGCPAPRGCMCCWGWSSASRLVGVAGLTWAWYHGDRLRAGCWLAFVPMLVALPFPVARWLALVPLGFWTQHAIQLALAVTLPAVFLLLILRSQERRDYRRRITPARPGGPAHRAGQ
jgi:hypothetical protein